jgi:GNAT superfamily N-acetyltransferase
VVDIQRLSPDDSAGIAETVAMLDAARLADLPAAVPHDVTSYTGVLRYGWDGEPPTVYLGRVDGTLVGEIAIDLPSRENHHLAWLSINVHPEHRRRGFGSELLAFGLEIARKNGRRSAATDGHDLPAGRGFAAKHGFEQKSVEVRRRQTMADLDWDVLDKLYDEALAASREYELLRIEGAVPADMLDAVVTMTAALNDAPTDDLEIDDDVYTPERIRAFETAMDQGWNRRTYRVVARHKESGELGGHTIVGVERERPQYGWQYDTAVVREHRGHRLGLLVKIEALRWLREAEPKLVSFDTWNAESNKHMIAVNEQLGYRVIARDVSYQRAV